MISVLFSLIIINIYFSFICQQVIPPVYQGHKDVNVWSPFLYGNNVPVAPYNGIALAQDQSNGAINLLIKINGRVRWKVGSFISGRYHLHVACAAYIPIGNSKNTGIVIGNAVKYQLSQSCTVNVWLIFISSCFFFLVYICILIKNCIFAGNKVWSEMREMIKEVNAKFAILYYHTWLINGYAVVLRYYTM